jgi:hypothetical protein
VDAGTAYVAADRHRLDENAPIIYRTHDFGENWERIVRGLPEDEWVGVVRQDPEAPTLLYAGTNRGMYVSFDDGENWKSLQLDLPITGINDMVVHRGDLVLATQGRAIWALDDLTVLRGLATRGWRNELSLTPPAPAYRLRFNQNRDTPLPVETPRGENPPVGAVFDYFIPGSNGDEVQIEVLDADGAVLRRVRSDDVERDRNARVYFADVWLGPVPVPSRGGGHHRFVWDLRLPAPETLRSSYAIAAVPGRPTPIRPEGAMVEPGTYTVRLTVGDELRIARLTVLPDPRVQATEADYAALFDFQARVVAVLERAVDVAHDVGEAIHRLSEREDAGDREALEGLRRAQGQGRERAAAVANELTSLATDLEAIDAPPTEAQLELLDDASARLEVREAALEQWWAELDPAPRR